MFGRFENGPRTIPYFQVGMTYADIKEYLKLVSDMPGAAEMDWEITELFQRDIDYIRVKKEIVPYLRDTNTSKFFNSLTIALVPLGSDNAIGSFSEGDWDAPELAGDPFAKKVNFGPLACGYWNSWQNPDDPGALLGQLSWNMKQIAGIAVDGQHRLAAIKDIESSSNTRVPVILMVLHKDLGYDPGGGDVVSTIRKVFIDLNKHAQIVNRARQILLDDRDPRTMCVRAIIGNKLTRGKAELQADDPAIPLSLVDWHSESALFDKGPYLVTVLGLDWAVDKLLDIRPFDAMDHNGIRTAISRLESRLSIDLTDARTRLQDCEDRETPFAFMDAVSGGDELARIQSGFKKRFARPLIILLSFFRPYERLIEARATQNTLSPAFCNWFALKEQADKANRVSIGAPADTLARYEARIAQDISNPMSRTALIEAVKSFNQEKKVARGTTESLAFTVVFQRALIVAFGRVCNVNPQEVEALAAQPIDITQTTSGQSSEIPIYEQRAQELIEALNRIEKRTPKWLTTRYECDVEPRKLFWSGSLRNPEGPIDFTQGASQRTQRWLVLAWQYYIVKQSGKYRAPGDFGRLQEELEDPVGFMQKVSQEQKGLYTSSKSVGGRIVFARDEDPNDIDVKRDELMPRFEWLWKTISE
jgi:hypothetical protein